MSLKQFLVVSFSIACSFFVFILLIYLWVGWSSNKRIYTNVADVPKQKVALVLGTSKSLTSGNDNWYFLYRIEAAVELYQNGKVEKILVSGDNRTHHYNEPMDMKKALIERGVAEEDVILDYAGLRTFDSVVRAKKIFRQNQIIIVSQKFHLQRALFIARAKGVEATGFRAKDPKVSYASTVREFPARVKAFLDCYILGTQPRHLGKKEPIDFDV